jgi:hypothetical protein
LSTEIHAYGKCLRCYRRDWARKKREANPKPPKPLCKCKKCYDHNWRITHPEQALANDRRHREKANANGYTYEYNHRPEVVETRRKRDAGRRQTDEYKEYQAFFTTLRREINRLDLPVEIQTTFNDVPIRNLDIILKKTSKS